MTRRAAGCDRPSRFEEFHRELTVRPPAVPHESIRGATNTTLARNMSISVLSLIAFEDNIAGAMQEP
jgi:hypothetical protein